MTGYRWLGIGPAMAVLGAAMALAAALLLPFWSGERLGPEIDVFLLKLRICQDHGTGMSCRTAATGELGFTQLWTKLTPLLVASTGLSFMLMMLISVLSATKRLATRLWLCNLAAGVCLFSAALAIWTMSVFDFHLQPQLQTVFAFFCGLAMAILGSGFVRMRVSRSIAVAD